MVDVEYLFRGKQEQVFILYELLVVKMAEIGDFMIEPKKTCLHIVKNAAFLGIHPKNKWLDINIVSNVALEHPMLIKVEQVSKNRFHNSLRLERETDINSELITLIKEAYLLKLK
ncbi:MAG: DUF5655 domain-containing protein [Culicoidibacterales bacterium]